jgi:hypothetical protein
VISFKPFSTMRPALRWLRPAATATLTAAALLIVGTAPAGAQVTEVAGTTVGVQPRDEVNVLDAFIPVLNGKKEIAKNPNGEIFNEATTMANPAGNPVVHSSNVYAIYWDPTGGVYRKEWQTLINVFMREVGADSGTLGSVFAVDTQYTDLSNAPAAYKMTFRGAYADTDPYPKAGCVDPQPLKPGRLEAPQALDCVTRAQVEEELKTFIADHNLPKGMGSVFYLLTPPGVTVCLDAAATHCSDFAGSKEEASYENSFCSYHGDINPDNIVTGDPNTILYGMIPWTAGGRGNGYLNPQDQTAAIDCQDGGFDPTTEPIEEKEKPKKVRSAEEEEKFKNSGEQEKKEIEALRALEGPHQEEPNQLHGHDADSDYDTGLADLIINQVAVEQQNIVTNPLLNGWQDDLKNEVTDECRNFFASNAGGMDGSSAIASQFTDAGTLSNQVYGSGHYYLNNAFNLSSLKLGFSGIECLGGVNLVPRFTSPNPVNTGDIVGFDGMESQVELAQRTVYSATGTPEKSYATYSWDFGDGSPEVTGFAPGSPSLNSPETSPCEAPWLKPCAASTYHAYQYGGNYEVTLTITDVGGNKERVTNTITVDGPAKPVEAPPPPAGSSSGTTPGTTTTGTTSTPPPAPPAIPAPVAQAAIISRTLSSATRKGLVVRYSVNEQVAGHFEVLMSRSVAARLGISGAPASGLPKGTPPQIVIARATLVTTKGGRSAFNIHFSKRTAARLRRLHSVSLTLLLAVHNASAQSPATTTVISTTTLVG